MGGFYSDTYPGSALAASGKYFRSSTGEIPFTTEIQGSKPPDSRVQSYRTHRSDALTNQELYATLGDSGNYNTPFDRGHEFRSTQRRLLGQPFVAPRVYLTGISGTTWVEGPLIPNVSSGVLAGLLWPGTPPVINTGYYGPLAVKQMMPKTHQFSPSQFIGELSRLPSIPLYAASMRQKTKVFKEAGKEHLNAQFGWTPFLNDIANLLVGIMDIQRISDEFLAGSGKISRNGWGIEETINENLLTTGSTGASILQKWGLPTNATYWQTVVPVTVNRSTRREIFAVGAFQYYAKQVKELGKTPKKAVDLYNRILDYRITPEVLWELAPWSWLADWVGNIGINLTNYTAFELDGYCMRYGYLMQTSTIHQTIEIQSKFWLNPALTVVHTRPTTMVSLTIDKQRVRATPYGFGLNPASFSSRQWAILAALGMTRGEGKLRYAE